MLVGQYCAVITEKGRLAIPARFRREVGRKLVIAKWLEGCLVAISQARFNTIVENLIGKHEIATLSVRETERFLLGSAFEVELDAQGRFVVPAVLKDYAALTHEVVFIGLGNRFEIWSKEAWYKKESQLQQEAEKMIERLAEGKG